MPSKMRTKKDYERPEKAPHIAAAQLLEKYGIEHALYLAFSAGKHGEVTYPEWLDRTAESAYITAKKYKDFKERHTITEKEGEV